MHASRQASRYGHLRGLVTLSEALRQPKTYRATSHNAKSTADELQLTAAHAMSCRIYDLLQQSRLSIDNSIVGY